ncbi:MAG TPA: hypothetical protein VEK57_26135 [Thermoanaerobaculia bacterium]|nr:hypothetical protein [Thermoanaerobaculia bacterium]
MRRVLYSVGRGVSAMGLVLVLAGSLSAAPQERDRDVREKERSPIVKVVKKVIRSFGDFLTIPRP